MITQDEHASLRSAAHHLGRQRPYLKAAGRLLWPVLIPILTAAVGVPTRALAQDPGDVRLGITYTPGYVPSLSLRLDAQAGMEAIAASVDTILRRDLDYSDHFQITPLPDSLDTDPINYGLLNQLGLVWLVSGRLLGTPAQPVLRLTLNDVVYSTLKSVQAFTLPEPGAADFRMAVHRAADAVVEWATGDPGIAASRIAFRRKAGDGTSDIYAIESDALGLERLTDDHTMVTSPAYSSDGRYLLYAAYVEDRWQVFERDLTTGRRRLISGEPGLNITPSYSPDGNRILLARSIVDHTEVFELQREPLCCARRITSSGTADALGPTYAPDGKRIAFTSNALGLPQVYVQSLTGGRPDLISVYVYGEPGYSTSPDWSPRGDRIAYQSWVNQVFQIVTVDPDGSNRRILTSQASNEDPSWAPDGRHLVFSSSRAGRRALWVLDTVTGRLRSLTVGQVDELPSWSASFAAGP